MDSAQYSSISKHSRSYIEMKLKTRVPSSRRDRLKEALIHRNYSRQSEEERKPMVTQLSPHIKNVATMIVDDDLPYDELRQILDDRMHVDSSFVSEPFDEQEVPEIVCKPFDEQEVQGVPESVSDAYNQELPEIVSEPFLKQVSGSVAEPAGATPELEPALESVANPVLYETSTSNRSECNLSESDENSTIDECGSHYSIDDCGDIQEFIGEVTFTSFMEDEEEIEVHLGETSIIVERIDGIKDMNPTNRNKVAEDDDKSEVTCDSAHDNTVDTDDYDSDASWASDSPLPDLFKESPLPDLFKEFMFQRLTCELSALTSKVFPSDIREGVDRYSSAGIGTWF
jgi:hypothetical protein